MRNLVKRLWTIYRVHYGGYSAGLGERQLWIAANTLPDEDTVVARIHATLRSRHKALLTVVAPRVAPTSNSSSNSYAEAARRLSSQKRLKVVMLSAAVQDPHRESAISDFELLLLTVAPCGSMLPWCFHLCGGRI